MRRGAIVSPLRTAVGGFGGTLRSRTADMLAASVLKALVARSGIDPARTDEVAAAQSHMSGEAPCIARYAAIATGLPIEVAGYALDRRCGSSLQAVIDAATIVATGAEGVVVALGVESMSNIEYQTTALRRGAHVGTVKMHDRLQRGPERPQPEERFGHIYGMPETAESLRREYCIHHEEADAHAVESHRKAAAAWAEGRFEHAVIPLEVPRTKGDPVVFARDEGVRPGTTLETIAVTVEGDIDLRRFFAIDDGVRPGFERSRVRVRIESSASEEALERQAGAVNRHCPVLDMLTKPVPVTCELSRAGGSQTG